MKPWGKIRQISLGGDICTKYICIASEGTNIRYNIEQRELLLENGTMNDSFASSFPILDPYLHVAEMGPWQSTSYIPRRTEA